MNKYLLAIAFALVSASSYAATISTTLILTSPTAYISMTAVSATAYLTTVRSTLTSSTSVSATNVSASLITSRQVPVALSSWNGTSGAVSGTSFNVSSITRTATGIYGVSFTNPLNNSNYRVFPSYQLDNTFSIVCGMNGNRPKTTTGFYVRCGNSSTGADIDAPYVNVMVFEN